MSTAVQTMETRISFSRDQVQLLKDTICRGASDDELRLFLTVCEKKGLDPFSKQIHGVRRWDSTLKKEVLSFQIGIDGFRMIAERSGKYAGQAPFEWTGSDGKWVDCWLDTKPPAAARCTVYRSDFQKPLTRIALFREYVQTNREGNANAMWTKMPANQLAKCAEALALRAAFPELSGLYEPAEMDQAENNPPEAPPQPKRTRPALVRKPEPAPEPVDVAPVEEPAEETPTEETSFRVPDELELRNGLRKGLEKLPDIQKAWVELYNDFTRAGCEQVLPEIQKRFGVTEDGQRTPLSLRRAVWTARFWRDDHLEFFLKQPEETV